MKHLIKPCFVKMAEAVVKKHKGAVAVVYKLGEGKSHRKVGGVTRTVRQVVGAVLHAVVVVAHFQIGCQPYGTIFAAAGDVEISAGQLCELWRYCRLHEVTGILKHLHGERQRTVLKPCFVKLALGNFKTAAQNRGTFTLGIEICALLFQLGDGVVNGFEARLRKCQLALDLIP